jgi:hypothetical protein
MFRRPHRLHPYPTMAVPLTIDTPRLTLRQLVNDDWVAMHEHYSDLECTKFTFGRAFTGGRKLEGYGEHGRALAIAGLRSIRCRRKSYDSPDRGRRPVVSQ